VENFYIDYACDVGFSIRIGQQKIEIDEIVENYFYCLREGYRKENGTQVDDQSIKKRKTHNEMESMCGCDQSMCGVPPHLMITGEVANMKAAITKILPDITQRFYMWHIIDKVPEKVGPSLRGDHDFWDRLNSCVWGSETREEFET
jgi:hypothetical protein